MVYLFELKSVSSNVCCDGGGADGAALECTSRVGALRGDTSPCECIDRGGVRDAIKGWVRCCFPLFISDEIPPLFIVVCKVGMQCVSVISFGEV